MKKQMIQKAIIRQIRICKLIVEIATSERRKKHSKIYVYTRFSNWLSGLIDGCIYANSDFVPDYLKIIRWFQSSIDNM